MYVYVGEMGYCYNIYIYIFVCSVLTPPPPPYWYPALKWVWRLCAMLAEV
jgi:hypothetical protein